MGAFRAFDSALGDTVLPISYVTTAPVNGTAGTFAGSAAAVPGAILIYAPPAGTPVTLANIGTQASPIWAAEYTFAGSSTAIMAEEGNINRQIPGVAGAIAPAATGADVVVAVYSVPANFFDGLPGTNRGLTAMAQGNFAANANTKRIKLWFNPSAAVVGSTIGAGGTLMADTTAVVTNGGGWFVGGNVFKRGGAATNTQTVTSNGAIAGGVHQGMTPCVDSTATENAAILVAVTINNTTTATDAVLSQFEVNAMN